MVYFNSTITTKPYPLWWLNKFMNNLQIGRWYPESQLSDWAHEYPPRGAPLFGPCQMQQASLACKFDVSILPDNIKNIALNLPLVGSTTVGQLITSGIIKIYLLQIDAVEFGALSVTGSPFDALHSNFTLNVTNFNMNVKFQLDIGHLQAMGTLNVPDISQISVQLLKQYYTGLGTDLGLTFSLSSRNPATGALRPLATNIANNLQLTSCSLDADLGIHVPPCVHQLQYNPDTIDCPQSTIPFATDMGSVVNFAAGLIQTVAGPVACFGIDYLLTNSTNQPGLLNQIIQKLGDKIFELAGRTEEGIATQEARILNALPASVSVEDLVNFEHSKVIGLASDIVNDWLGPQPGGAIEVNQVMNLLTNNTGRASFGGLADLGFTLPIHTPPVIATIIMHNVSLTGLNTFTDFSVLEKSGYNTTFNNKIGIGSMGVHLLAELNLAGNYWVDGYGNGKVGWAATNAANQSMLLDYNLSLSGLVLNASVLIANVPKLMKTMQIGQVLGKTGTQHTLAAELKTGLLCGAVSMINMSLPILRVNIGALPDPVFAMGAPDVDVGLENLINNATTAILGIVRPAILYNLGDISEFWLRPMINHLLWSTMTPSDPEQTVAQACKPYVSVGHPIYPDIEGGMAFPLISKLVSKVIGGDPVPPSSNKASINYLLPLLLNHTFTTFGISAVNLGGAKYQIAPNFVMYPGRSFHPGDNSTSLVIKQITIDGLDTMSKLVLQSTGPSQFSAAIALNSFTLKVETKWVANYLASVFPPSMNRKNINEDWTIQIAISGLTIDIASDVLYNLDKLYQLEVGQATHLPCLLSPVVSGMLTSSLGLTSVSVTNAHVNDTTNDPTNLISQGLSLLNGESYTTLSNIVRFVLQSVSDGIAVDLKANGLDASNCSASPSFANTVLFRLVKSALTANISDVIARGTGPQPAVPSPEQLDLSLNIPDQVASFDLQDSALFALVPSGVSLLRGNAANVKKGLKTLANTTAGSGIVQINDHNGIDAKLNLSALIDPISLHIILANSTVQPGVVTITDIDGLDFPSLYLLNPVSKYVLDNYISLPGKRDITVSLYLNLPNSMFTGVPGPGMTSEVMTLTLSVTDFKIALQVLMAVDPSSFSSLSLGSLFSVDATQKFSLNKNLLNCLFGVFISKYGAPGLQIPLLNMTMSALQVTLNTHTVGQTTSKLFSPGTQVMVNGLLQTLIDFWVHDMGDVTQGLLRSLVNDLFLKPHLEDAEQFSCPAPVVPQGTLDFQASKTINAIANFTKSTLAGSDGKYTAMNQLINLVTSYPAQMFHKHPLGFTNVPFIFKHKMWGIFTFHISDVWFNNLGAFSVLNLFNPVSPLVTHNEIKAVGPTSLHFNLDFIADSFFLPVPVLNRRRTSDSSSSSDAVIADDIVDSFVAEEERGRALANNSVPTYSPTALATVVSPTSSQLVDQVEITITWGRVDVVIDLELGLDLPILMKVPIGDFVTLSRLSCVSKAITTLKLITFHTDFNLDDVHGTVFCHGRCDSAMFNAAKAAPVTWDAGGSNAVHTVGKYVPLVLGFVNEQLNGRKWTSGNSNTSFAADEACAVSMNLTMLEAVLNPEPEPDLNVATILALFVLGAGAGFAALIPLLIPRHFQIKSKMIQANLLAANEVFKGDPQKVAKHMSKLEVEMRILGFHPAISLFWRLFLPALACANVVMLGCAFTMYLMFMMDVTLVVFGDYTQTIGLVPWAISNTINDMWNSGAWPVALLVIFASCAWPIVKNLALCFIWFSPRTFINPDNKLRYLIILDILGKWSFLDVYIIVMLVTGLHMNLNIAYAPSLAPAGLYAEALDIHVGITPGNGIVFLCLAAGLSLVVNHIMIWQSRKAAYADARLFCLIDGKEDDMLSPKALVKIALSDYMFTSVNPMTGLHDQFSPRAKRLIRFSLIGTACLCLASDFMPLWTFYYNGIVGYTLQFFFGYKTRTYSLMTGGITLGEANVGTPSSVALFSFFQLLYFVSIVVAPILQMILHYILFFFPWNIQEARHLLYLSKVAAYWASVEVYLVGTVAMVIEVQPISFFLFDGITGGVCGALEPVLAEFMNPGQNNCLTLVATLDWGFPLILLICLLQINVGAAMNRASGVAIRDRLDTLEGRLRRKEWTFLEYFVMKYLLLGGAEHHKPQQTFLENVGITKAAFMDFARSPFAYCRLVNPFAGCCAGIEGIGMNDGWGGAVKKDKEPEMGSKWLKPHQFQAKQDALAMAAMGGYGYGGPGQSQMMSPMMMGGPGMSQMGSPPPPGFGYGSPQSMQAANPVYSLEHQRVAQPSTQSRVSVDV